MAASWSSSNVYLKFAEWCFFPGNARTVVSSVLLCSITIHVFSSSKTNNCVWNPFFNRKEWMKCWGGHTAVSVCVGYACYLSCCSIWAVVWWVRCHPRQCSNSLKCCLCVCKPHRTARVLLRRERYLKIMTYPCIHNTKTTSWREPTKKLFNWILFRISQTRAVYELLHRHNGVADLILQRFEFFMFLKVSFCLWNFNPTRLMVSYKGNVFWISLSPVHHFLLVAHITQTIQKGFDRSCPNHRKYPASSLFSILITSRRAERDCRHLNLS